MTVSTHDSSAERAALLARISLERSALEDAVAPFRDAAVAVLGAYRTTQTVGRYAVVLGLVGVFAACVIAVGRRGAREAPERSRVGWRDRIAMAYRNVQVVLRWWQIGQAVGAFMNARRPGAADGERGRR